MTDNRLDLRIDPTLKARVKAAAEAEDRSLTRWVIRALESALSASETPSREAVEEAFAALTDRELEDFAARVRAGSLLQRVLGASETPEPTRERAKRMHRAGTPLEQAMSDITYPPKCPTCAKHGPPKARPCVKCGHQR